MPPSMRDQARAMQDALRRKDQALRQAAERAAQQSAATVRDAIRDRIPPGGTDSRFPGYAATGTMKNSIVAGPVRPVEKGFVAEVGVAHNADSHLLKVMAAHEGGVTIRPKRGKLLAFKVKGQLVFARQAVIKPKHFFRDGWAAGKARAADQVEETIQQALNGGGQP